jgi:hypothetical protein
MKTKIILLVGFAVVVLGCVVTTILVIRREPGQPEASQMAEAGERKTNLAPAVRPETRVPAPVVEPSLRERLALKQNIASSEGNEQIKPVKPAGPVAAKKPAAAANAEAELLSRLNDPVVKEELGRYALSWVGADSDADEMWLWTINDPSLSAKARKNLIEDLNEDGFSDPKNPTVEDLPLIESRLALIEEVAPDAMDEDNAAAFLEAYKDLVNMWIRLAQQ